MHNYVLLLQHFLKLLTAFTNSHNFAGSKGMCVFLTICACFWVCVSMHEQERDCVLHVKACVCVCVSTCVCTHVCYVHLCVFRTVSPSLLNMCKNKYDIYVCVQFSGSQLSI